MVSRENLIAQALEIRGKAMGFFLKSWKTLQEGTQPRGEKTPQERVGVDLGQSHLRVLALEIHENKPRISFLHVEKRPASNEEISKRLRSLFTEKGLASKGIRIALRGQGVVTRILNFPQMKKEDFSSSIKYEAEKYIPFKSDEVVVDFQILNENIQRGNSKFMEVLLVAAKKIEIEQVLSLYQQAGFTVELIDLSAFAVANLIESLIPEAEKASMGFIDMGTENSTFGILLRGKPVFLRDISFGGSDVIKLIRRKLGLEPEAVLNLLENPSKMTAEFRKVVELGLANLLAELKLSLGYYLDHVAGAEPLGQLFVVGGGFRFAQDLKFLEQEINIPLRRLECVSRMEMGPGVDASLVKKNEDLLSVAAGLCLRP